VISASPELLARVEQIAAQYKVEAQRIGTVTHGDFRIQVKGQLRICSTIDLLRQIWTNSLETSLQNG
jgi:hypothetical protein